jgi:nucleoid-associated protein YgaU
MIDRKRMGLALSGVACVATAGLAWWQADGPAPEPARLLPTVAAVPSRAAAPATAPANDAPRFDVARIGATGSTVVAGRAAPNAEVTLLDSDRELGRGRADARGEFVILPAEPLRPGAHELTLRSLAQDGREKQGEESVVVMVPDAPEHPSAQLATAIVRNPAAAGNAAPGPGAVEPAVSGGAPSAATQAPLVVLLPRPGADIAPRLLQGATSGAVSGEATKLGLDVVDYDDAGAMRFAGTVPPGQSVRVYVDQAHAGDAKPDAAGRWSLQPRPVPEPGRHILRVDQINPRGRVAARLELPFLRDTAAGQPVTEQAGTRGRMVVQPGHNLWRIARATYGRGIRYTVIHQANAEQIRDPARIYPGQIFTLPTP